MPTVGRRSNALTAAASRRRITRGDWQRSDSPDARSLFDLYERCGAVKYGLNFKANAASKITYFVGRRDDPRAEPEPAEGGVFDEAYTRLRGPQGEFPDFVGQFCLQADIVGEGYLVGMGAGENAAVDADEWAVWSAVEWDESKQAKRHPDETEARDEGDFAVRVWRPHPMRRHKPDSPLRSVAQQVEQYILFEDMISATTYSRIPAGLLLIPDEILTNEKNPTTGEDYIPLLENLQTALVSAVTDTQSAARIAPFYIHGPGERLEQIRVLDIIRDLPEKVAELMERVLRQIASGLDLPAEILLGMADINHWGQWLIDDSARLNHVDPLVLLILDSLTRGYLHPYLEAAGVPDAESYLFWRDYSDLTSRTLTIDESVGLLDRQVISKEAMLRIADLNEEDAFVEDTDQPTITGEELVQRVTAAGTLIRSGFTPEASLAAVGLPAIDHTGLLPVTVKDDAQLPSQPGAEPADITEDEPAVEDVDVTNDRDIPDTLVASAVAESLAEIDFRLFHQIAEASQAALDRALEKAGNRIRSETRNKRSEGAEARALIANVESARVGLVLGREVLETLQLSEDQLLPEGTFSGLGLRVEYLLRKGQDDTAAAIRRLTGQEPDRDLEEERTWRDTAKDWLVAALSALALSRFFTPTIEPDPAETGEISDTDIPAADVWATLTLAGGGTLSDLPDRPRGLANGQQATEWITDAGASIEGYVWATGSPAEPFEPHQSLSGVRFTSFEDAQLANVGVWPPTPFYYPGDHRGCQCTRVLVVEPPNER